MISRRPPHKLDIFVVLIFFVAVGVSASIAYQVDLYYNQGGLAVAEQPQPQQQPLPPDTGG